MRVRTFLLLVAGFAAALLAWGYGEAVSEPRIRTAKLDLAGWPDGAARLRILLLSDLHVAGPDMPPERLAEILDRAAAERPDIVLIAGDLISDKRLATRRYGLAEAVAPLKRLHPRLGTFAVLGNHDHWRNAGEARRALAAAGVRVLDNDSVQIGPLALGGLDDAFTGHDRLASTLASMSGLHGARIMLSHSPDPFPELPGDVALMVAGHTHCGQIRLPLVGAISTMSRYGERYACGLVRENGKTLVVSAGLGTSILPIRIGAPPDYWLLDVGGIRVRNPRPVGAR
jgi:predicted MPP superfamily phosphohydrolase